jgi:hypothetical protein
MANFKDSGKSGLGWALLVVIPMAAAVAIPMWIALAMFADTKPAMPKIEMPKIEESWWSPSTWGATEAAETAVLVAESAGAQAVASSFNSSITSMSLTAVAMTVAAVLGGVWLIAACLTPAGRKEQLNTPAQRQAAADAQDRRLGELADRDAQRQRLNNVFQVVQAMRRDSEGRLYIPQEEKSSAGEPRGAKAPAKTSAGQHDLAMEEEEVS